IFLSGAILRNFLVELSIGNKKELCYQENKLFNFVKMVNFSFGKSEISIKLFCLIVFFMMYYGLKTKTYSHTIPNTL
ncbi:MAG: hypothetical protein PHF46_04705, partial [Candidatus Gracilibacteria bacterium]|nr:hypothetical protein [Candidatus Gracilibacteria bacterium]